MHSIIRLAHNLQSVAEVQSRDPTLCVLRHVWYTVHEVVNGQQAVFSRIGHWDKFDSVPDSPTTASSKHLERASLLI
jgi:hypothetical protein